MVYRRTTLNVPLPAAVQLKATNVPDTLPPSSTFAVSLNGQLPLVVEVNVAVKD